MIGMVATFAEPLHDGSRRRVPLELAAASDQELLVALLEEVVYLLDVGRVVPVAVGFDEAPGSVTGFVDVVPVDEVEVVGAPPKGVSRSDLEFGEHGGVWQCHVVVDV